MRELKARYRGSTLGFLWSFLHPLLLISVYTLVFSVYLRFGMDDYIVSFASGLLPWMWFSSSLLEASNSILAGGNLIKKVLFPAGVLPLVVVLSNFVNFLLSLPILLLFVVFFNRPIGLSIMGLPIVMLIQLVFTTGLAFMFSALCVHYRDVQHILANLLNLWFFLTPIIYPPEQVSGFLRIIISLNPVAPLILAYRNIFYKNLFPSFMQLSIVAAMAILIYLLGASIFERYSVIFAEEV